MFREDVFDTKFLIGDGSGLVRSTQLGGNYYLCDLDICFVDITAFGNEFPWSCFRIQFGFGFLGTFPLFVNHDLLLDGQFLVWNNDFFLLLSLKTFRIVYYVLL